MEPLKGYFSLVYFIKMEPCNLNLIVIELALNKGMTISCQIHKNGYNYNYGSPDFINQGKTI